MMSDGMEGGALLDDVHGALIQDPEQAVSDKMEGAAPLNDVHGALIPVLEKSTNQQQLNAWATGRSCCILTRWPNHISPCCSMDGGIPLLFLASVFLLSFHLVLFTLNTLSRMSVVSILYRTRKKQQEELN
jgi:hypothetical protein